MITICSFNQRCSRCRTRSIFAEVGCKSKAKILLSDGWAKQYDLWVCPDCKDKPLREQKSQQKSNVLRVRGKTQGAHEGVLK